MIWGYTSLQYKYPHFILKQDPYDHTMDSNLENFCYIFWFSYGTIIFWNMTEMEERSIIEQTKQFEIVPNEVERDTIEYEGNLNS